MKQERYCIGCRNELTDQNSRDGASYCIWCESKHFKKIEEANGTHLALFACCMAFNVPCEPLIVPENFADEKEDKWQTYLALLYENNKFEKNGVARNFFDGETNIRKIFGRNLDQTDFAKYVDYEQKRLGSLMGTAEQRERWGTEPLWKDVPMTAEIYLELDRQYQMRLASYRGMTITPTMEDVLVKVARLNVVMNLLMSKGRTKEIGDIQKIVDSLLALEQMRKKDEKPVEAMRIDALVDSLEKAGLMENGQFLTYDETVNALRDHFIKSKKYDYSLDVADQTILAVLNTMRANADMPQIFDLNDDETVDDEYGEFEAEETEREKAAKRYVGLTKIDKKTSARQKEE